MRLLSSRSIGLRRLSLRIVECALPLLSLREYHDKVDSIRVKHIVTIGEEVR